MDNPRTYREEIQSRMNYVQEFHRIKNTEVIKICRFILHIGKEEEDAYLLGYAYYYIGEAYYFTSNTEKAASNLMTSIRYQQSCSDYDRLARSHNLLGIIHINNGNSASALEHFFTSLFYCRQYGFQYTEGIVHTNIASIYTGIQDYKNAAVYYRKALKLFDLDKKSPLYAVNYTMVSCSLGMCYVGLGCPAPAAACLRKVEHLNPLHDEAEVIPCISMFYSKYYNLSGDFCKRDLYIEQSISCIRNCPNFIFYIDDYFEHCSFLLQIKDYCHLLELLDILASTPEIQDITNFKFTILELRMQYLKHTGRTEALCSLLPAYYQLSEQMGKESEHSSLSSMKIRLSYENTMRRQKKLAAANARLRIRSERDGMTGLPNRIKLNDQADEWFNAAVSQHILLGIEIFDIDHFKQYNDTYGHLAGDDCLRAISKLLLDMAGGTVFCARYGGDEFIILYFNKTNEEIFDLAEKLRKSVAELKIEHCLSTTEPYVTITQGISNSLPLEEKRIWDYMHMADEALYRLKKGGRRNHIEFYGD